MRKETGKRGGKVTGISIEIPAARNKHLISRIKYLVSSI